MATQLYNESANGQTIHLAIGQTIEICLEENPTTGFRWQLMADLEAACATISDAFVHPGGPPGRGGEHRWIFEAVRSGGCDIELRYRRRWGNPVEPERMFRIHVEVESPEHSAEPGP
jgi:inhibitor of cysteine peptidase